MLDLYSTKRKPVYSEIACRCGLTFAPSTSRQKHCSPECRFREIAAPFLGVIGCWEWPKGYFSKSGYGQFAVNANTPETAHRMSYKIFNGPVPQGLYVCHACDNRKCFNPDHLFAGTPLDNITDMMNKGRRAKNIRYLTGDNSPRRTKPQRYLHLQRFTDPKQLDEIVQLCSQQSIRSVARLFGCSHAIIRRVLARHADGSAQKTELLAQAEAIK